MGKMIKVEPDVWANVAATHNQLLEK